MHACRFRPLSLPSPPSLLPVLLLLLLHRKQGLLGWTAK
jgi:hypothetical protein